MIKGFQTNHPLEPTGNGRLQWGAAIGAALIAGAVLLVVPRGSPWSSFTFFTPTVMGRSIAPLGLHLGLGYLIHLSVSILYGVVIATVVARLKKERAVFTGGLMGLAFYLINFGVVSTAWPELRGAEVPVVFTHIVFGLIAAGAYRGLLKRRPLGGVAS